MITQVLIATIIVGVLAFVNLAFAIKDYRRVITSTERRSQETIRAVRRVVVAFCWFSVPASFALRSALALFGLQNDVVGVVVFWSWFGVNLVGGLYAVISEWYD